MKSRAILVLVLSCCLSAWSQNQPVNIQGTVIDAQSRSPMPGVQVSFDETLVVTDSEGKFVLSNVKPASSYELSFARSGYVRQWQVFAWENIEPYAYFDPTVVQQA